MITVLKKIRAVITNSLKIFVIYFELLYDYIKGFGITAIPRYKIVSHRMHFRRCAYQPREFQFVIVFQGPIFGEFTTTTIRQYKKFFPSVDIVVSTWEGTDRSLIQALENSGAIVLLNTDVAHSYDNQNRMIASTAAGLRCAAERHPGSILIKHRGDQRCQNEMWLRNIENTLTLFEANCSLGSKYRLGSVSSCSGKLRPFMLGDQFQFGHASDMVSLWSAPNVEVGLPELFRSLRFNNYLKYGFGIKADNYLVSHYLLRNNVPFDFTLQDSVNFWRTKGIVLDDAAVGLSWIRKEYDKKIESVLDVNPFNGSIGKNQGITTLSFYDWLHIYKNGDFDFQYLKAEVWAVKSMVNGLPVYQIEDIGGLK